MAINGNTADRQSLSVDGITATQSEESRARRGGFMGVLSHGFLKGMAYTALGAVGIMALGTAIMGASWGVDVGTQTPYGFQALGHVSGADGFLTGMFGGMNIGMHALFSAPGLIGLATGGAIGSALAWREDAKNEAISKTIVENHEMRQELAYARAQSQSLAQAQVQDQARQNQAVNVDVEEHGHRRFADRYPRRAQGETRVAEEMQRRQANQANMDTTPAPGARYA